MSGNPSDKEWLPLFVASVDMVFLPGNLVEPDGFQKLYNILSSVIVWGSIIVLAHEDDGHIGEEAGKVAAGVYQPGGVAGDFWSYGYDGEGHPLFDDDGSMYGHGNDLLLVCLVNSSIF